jgi:hypothetical protein
MVLVEKGTPWTLAGARINSSTRFPFLSATAMPPSTGSAPTSKLAYWILRLATGWQAYCVVNSSAQTNSDNTSPVYFRRALHDVSVVLVALLRGNFHLYMDVGEED